MSQEEEGSYSDDLGERASTLGKGAVVGISFAAVFVCLGCLVVAGTRYRNARRERADARRVEEGLELGGLNSTSKAHMHQGLLIHSNSAKGDGMLSAQGRDRLERVSGASEDATTAEPARRDRLASNNGSVLNLFWNDAGDAGGTLNPLRKATTGSVSCLNPLAGDYALQLEAGESGRGDGLVFGGAKNGIFGNLKKHMRSMAGSVASIVGAKNSPTHGGVPSGGGDEESRIDEWFENATVAVHADVLELEALEAAASAVDATGEEAALSHMRELIASARAAYIELEQSASPRSRASSAGDSTPAKFERKLQAAKAKLQSVQRSAAAATGNLGATQRSKLLQEIQAARARLNPVARRWQGAGALAAAASRMRSSVATP